MNQKICKRIDELVGDNRPDWLEITSILNKELGLFKTNNAYRSLYARYRKGIMTENKVDKSKYTYTPNQQTYEDRFIIGNEIDVTPEFIMEKHHLDPGVWQVVSFTSNVWQQSKDGESINLCQSKISVKPKADEFLTIEMIDEYFNHKSFNRKLPSVNYKYNTDGEVLEICYTDAHNGLLAWHEETGSDYDLKIAAERFRYCIEDVIARCKGKKIKKILFITLGDIIHTDNDQQTTTKGTFQQVDGRMAKIFDLAVDMLIESLDKLLKIAPIEYIYLSGNHDRLMGYTLAKLLKMFYSRDKNIQFDVSPNPQKYRMIGDGTYVIGLCHGDMSKKNLTEWLQKKIRTEIGKVKYASVHCGHLHSQSTYEKDGIIVKHLPALCESSFWEHKEGYSSDKALMCFIYDEKIGLRETWITEI